MILIGSSKPKTSRFNKIILIMSFFALLTGTFLIKPKHFSFHTPWIQAAYLLIIGFVLGILFLNTLSKNKTIRRRWLWRLAYLFLIILLIAVVHDAVTKTTFAIFS
jgi:uncharacterized membrane protein YozB (DUF420 family)